MNKPTQTQKLVVVTGASSGIGAATARELAARAFHVLAGVRREQDAAALQAVNLEPVMLDITKEADIATLAHRIENDPEGRPLQALVNNAGMAVNAPLETYPLSNWRRLFEVNLFGHVAMTQALLPALLQSGGTIVNVSSVGGKVAMGAYGPYAATKFALEAISDSLRREVGSLGVKVVVIEPGAVTTGMLNGVEESVGRIIAAMNDEQRGRYERLLRAVVGQAAASVPGGAPPEKVGEVIADAIATKRPRTRYAVGRGVTTLIRMTALLSDRMLDKVLAAALRPHLRTQG